MRVAPNGGVMQRRGGMPLVVTHGGAAALGYRNVLEALEDAMSNASDMFEFDVRRTADDRLVVHHDECIGGCRLRDLPLHDADAAATAAGYRIPRLEALLDRARGALRLDVEVKEPGYERSIIQALRDHGYGADDFVMTSFELPALYAVRAADPGVTTGLLVYDVTAAAALQLFAQSGAGFLGPDHSIVDDAMLQEAARVGAPLVPWTVNEPAVLDRLMRAPAIAGVITDRPRLAVQRRARLDFPGPP